MVAPISLDPDTSNQNQSQNYINGKEAAAIAGVTKMAVSKWISEGKLEATRQGKAYKVSVTSLRQFLAEREKEILKKPRSIPLAPPDPEESEELEEGGLPGERACSKCNRSWKLTEKYWHRHSVSKDGFHTICKMCRINGGESLETRNIVLQTSLLRPDQVVSVIRTFEETPGFLDVKSIQTERSMVKVLALFNNALANTQTIINDQKLLRNYKVRSWWYYTGTSLSVG